MTTLSFTSFKRTRWQDLLTKASSPQLEQTQKVQSTLWDNAHKIVPDLIRLPIVNNTKLHNGLLALCFSYSLVAHFYPFMNMKTNIASSVTKNNIFAFCINSSFALIQNQFLGSPSNQLLNTVKKIIFWGKETHLNRIRWINANSEKHEGEGLRLSFKILDLPITLAQSHLSICGYFRPINQTHRLGIQLIKSIKNWIMYICLKQNLMIPIDQEMHKKKIKCITQTLFLTGEVLSFALFSTMPKLSSFIRSFLNFARILKKTGPTLAILSG